MRTTILWTQRARRDLLDIGDFIALDKPSAAARLVKRIMEAVDRAAVFPAARRVVPEIDRYDIREVILDGYRIVYRVKDNQIVVLTVFEGHRLLSGSGLDSNTPNRTMR